MDITWTTEETKVSTAQKLASINLSTNVVAVLFTTTLGYLGIPVQLGFTYLFGDNSAVLFGDGSEVTYA